jgi:hypothetical protein
MLRAVTFWIQGTFPKYRYRKFVFETYLVLLEGYVVCGTGFT